MYPRGAVVAFVMVILILLAAILVLASRQGGQGRSQARMPGSSASGQPVGDVGPTGPTELTSFQADWPGAVCTVDVESASGPKGQQCGLGGIELYLWTYADQKARNAGREHRAAMGARTQACAPKGRTGTWSGSAGRGGSYIEYSISDSHGQCWARIWWDDGDSNPANSCALMLSAKWDKDLNGSWDTLRLIWMSHGYQFAG